MSSQRTRTYRDRLYRRIADLIARCYITEEKYKDDPEKLKKQWLYLQIRMGDIEVRIEDTMGEKDIEHILRSPTYRALLKAMARHKDE